MTFEQVVAVVDRWVAETLRNDEEELRERGGLAEHEIVERMREHADHCRAVRDRSIEEMRSWLRQS